MKVLRWGLASLLLACSRYTPPTPPGPRDATLIRAPVGRTWDAVIDIFADRNIPIRTIERVSGLIVTDELRVGDEGRLLADCGRVNGDSLSPNFARYNALVRGDSTSSSVKLTVVWTHVSEKATVKDCSTTHRFEQIFEEQVRRRSEDPSLPLVRQTTIAQESLAASPRASQPAGAAAPPPPVDPPAGPAPSDGTLPRFPADTLAYDARSNNVLLVSPNFARVIGDMNRKGMLLSYREVGGERLVVNLSATALLVPSLEYQLTQLFLAYGSTMIDATNPSLLLRASGREIGRYTRAGLEWEGQ